MIFPAIYPLEGPVSRKCQRTLPVTQGKNDTRRVQCQRTATHTHIDVHGKHEFVCRQHAAFLALDWFEEQARKATK